MTECVVASVSLDFSAQKYHKKLKAVQNAVFVAFVLHAPSHRDFAQVYVAVDSWL